MNYKGMMGIRPFEKPLDHLSVDGGYTSIFGKICIVGDSLSSGEIEYYLKDGSRHCFDMYGYSWGSYIGKMTGSEIKHMSFGGASAKWLLDVAPNNGYFTSEFKADAYIIALGYNDMFGCKRKVGTLQDVENFESNTVIAHYYRLIQELQKLNKEARFFFVTLAKTPFWPKEKQEAIKELRSMLMALTTYVPHSYLIDIYKYGPKHTNSFKKKFYQADHLNFEGYYLYAKLICSYVDYLIRKEPKSFLPQEYYENVTIGTKDLVGK